MATDKKESVKFTVEHFMQISEMKPYQAAIEVRGRDPKYSYRLVEDTPEALRYREQQGYEVVTAEADATVGGSIGQVDRRRRVGNELVLMRRPKEIHEMHLQALRRRAHEMQRGPVESFKGKAQKFGVEVVDEMKREVSSLQSAIDVDDDDA